MLVAESAVTDPSATVPFEDTQPPPITDNQELHAGLALEDGVVRRTWAVTTKPPPPVVPLWAFRAALVLAGITEAQVDALISSLPEPSKTVATIQWNYGNFIERGHPLIASLGSAMGLTVEQIGNVFRVAETLK